MRHRRPPTLILIYICSILLKSPKISNKLRLKLPACKIPRPTSKIYNFFSSPPFFILRCSRHKTPLKPFRGPVRLCGARKHPQAGAYRSAAAHSHRMVGRGCAKHCRAGRDGGLLGATQHAPPPALPSSPAGLKKHGGTRGAEHAGVVGKFPHRAAQRPPTSHSSTTRPCGPGRSASL